MMLILIVVTLLNTVLATGFSLAGLFAPGFIVKDAEASRTARVFALYALARSVPLLLAVLFAAFTASATGLIWLGGLAGLIQLADAAVGTRTGDPVKIWGPLVLGGLQWLVVLLAIGFGA